MFGSKPTTFIKPENTKGYHVSPIITGANVLEMFLNALAPSTQVINILTEGVGSSSVRVVYKVR